MTIYSVYVYVYSVCVVDEHLDLKEMVQDKVVAGKKALGAWFRRCRVEVGDINIGTFKKLINRWWSHPCCVELRFGSALEI